MVKNSNLAAWKVQAVAVVLCSLIGGAALVMPSVAQAEESGELDQRSALELIRTGNDAFEEGDFETAYESYEAAHAVLPEPTIRYRMGQAAQELGQIRDAIRHYEAYLQEGDDEDRIARIESVLPDLQTKLPATLVITSEPAQAGIIISGRGDVGRTPGEYEVDPGEFRVTLQLRGYADKVIEGEVVAEEEKTIHAELQTEEPRRISTTPDEDTSRLGLWGYTSAGLGVALLATGGAFSFLQAGVTAEVNEYNKRATTADRDELEGLKDDAMTYHRAALSSYIAGGVLTAVGVGIVTYDFMRSGDSDSQRVHLEGGVNPNGGFVGIRGNF